MNIIYILYFYKEKMIVKDIIYYITDKKNGLEEIILIHKFTKYLPFTSINIPSRVTTFYKNLIDHGPYN